MTEIIRNMIGVFYLEEDNTFEILKAFSMKENIYFDQEIYSHLLILYKMFKKYDKELLIFLIQQMDDIIMNNFSYIYFSEPELLDMYIKTYKSIFVNKRDQQILIKFPRDISTLIYKYDYYFEGKIDFTFNEELPISYLRQLSKTLLVGVIGIYITIWDIGKRSRYKILDDNIGQDITCLEVLSEEEIIAGYEDGKIIIWNINNSDKMVLEGHKNMINDIKILPNGNIMSVSNDGTIKLWENDTCIKTFTLHESNVFKIFSLDNETFILYDENRKLLVMDITDELPMLVLVDPLKISYVQIYNKNIIFGFDDGKIIVWNHKDKIIEKILTIHKYKITQLIIKDNYLISGAKNGEIIIWNMDDDYNIISRFFEHTSQIAYFNFLPDNRLISSALDSKIKIWNSEISDFTLEMDTICPALMIVFNEILITGGDNGELCIWK